MASAPYGIYRRDAYSKTTLYKSTHEIFIPRSRPPAVCIRQRFNVVPNKLFLSKFLPETSPRRIFAFHRATPLQSDGFCLSHYSNTLMKCLLDIFATCPYRYSDL